MHWRWGEGLELKGIGGVPSSLVVPPGDYLLAVMGETLLVSLADGDVNTRGTPLPRGTQLHVTVTEPEVWNVRSVGGAGRLTLTRGDTTEGGKAPAPRGGSWLTRLWGRR